MAAVVIALLMLGSSGELAVSPWGTCATRDDKVICWGVPRELLPDFAPDGDPFELKIAAGLSKIALGDAHVCGLDAKKKLRCVGQRVDGDLADPIRSPEGAPELASIAVDKDHGCGVTLAGRAVCWGSNYFAEANGKNRQGVRGAVEVDGVRDVVEVAVGQTFSCARTKAGKVACWGRLRYDDEPPIADLMLRFMKIAPSARIDAEGDLACSLSTAGAVECFVGFEHEDGPLEPIANVTALAVSSQGPCVLRTDKTISCAGYLASRLALKETPTRQFVQVPGASDVARFDVGGGVGCYRSSSGAIFCFGERGGVGTTFSDVVDVPVEAKMPEAAVAIGAGDERTCAITAAGALYCWGGENDPARPRKIEGISGAKRVAIGDDIACALRADGKALCFADRYSDAAAFGTGKEHSWGEGKTGPFEVPLGAAALRLALARIHGCAVLASGELSCWGRNYNGVLGRAQAGESPKIETPNVVLTGVVDVALSRARTCAVKKNGAVSCFGDPAEGMLGNGTTSSLDGAREVIGVERVSKVVLGERIACALGAGGKAWCWGRGALTAVKWPRADIADIAVRDDSACIVLNSGSVECGVPAHGLPVPKITDAIAIASGPKHSCVLRKGGSVACWGERRDGVLGDGIADFIAEPLPVAVP